MGDKKVELQDHWAAQCFQVRLGSLKKK